MTLLQEQAGEAITGDSYVKALRRGMPKCAQLHFLFVAWGKQLIKEEGGQKLDVVLSVVAGILTSRVVACEMVLLMHSY